MTLAEKPKSRPSDEPSPDKKVRTLGEALDEMGFAPLSPPRRIIIQEDHSEEPLIRWKKPARR
jgi:hypothetical protein